MSDELEDESYDINDDFTAICKGDPRCTTPKAERQNMVDHGGCVWCEKIWFDSNGTVQVEDKPGEA